MIDLFNLFRPFYEKGKDGKDKTPEQIERDNEKLSFVLYVLIAWLVLTGLFSLVLGLLYYFGGHL